MLDQVCGLVFLFVPSSVKLRVILVGLCHSQFACDNGTTPGQTRKRKWGDLMLNKIRAYNSRKREALLANVETMRLARAFFSPSTIT